MSNDKGQVSTSIQDLSNYNQLFIVAVDKDSVVSRNMEVKGLMDLKKDSPIPMRDLTLNKKVGSDDTGITEQRQAQCLNKD
jgi:hypothetical protein